MRTEQEIRNYIKILKDNNFYDNDSGEYIFNDKINALEWVLNQQPAGGEG